MDNEATPTKRAYLIQFLAKHKARVIFYGLLLVILLFSCIYLFQMNYRYIKSYAQTQEQTPVQPVSTAQTPTATKKHAGGEPVSTYLPETRRKIETGTAIRNPFNKAMVLKGIIIDGGKNMAIIESGNTAVIVTTGDEIDGGWTVKKINKTSVLVTSGEQETELKLNGR